MMQFAVERAVDATIDMAWYQRRRDAIYHGALEVAGLMMMVVMVYIPLRPCNSNQPCIVENSIRRAARIALKSVIVSIPVCGTGRPRVRRT